MKEKLEVKIEKSEPDVEYECEQIAEAMLKMGSTEFNDEGHYDVKVTNEDVKTAPITNARIKMKISIKLENVPDTILERLKHA